MHSDSSTCCEAFDIRAVLASGIDVINNYKHGSVDGYLDLLHLNSLVEMFINGSSVSG